MKMQHKQSLAMKNISICSTIFLDLLMVNLFFFHQFFKTISLKVIKLIFFFSVASEIELPPGEHVYPFTFSLPQNLPSSFEHDFGHVRYTVKAILDRPWKFDQETKSAFTVVSNFDLNREARALVSHYSFIDFLYYILFFISTFIN